jgi:glycerol-3-phosphate dehydrogenase
VTCRAGENGTLRGACVYYDGQFNDSRMAVALALSGLCSVCCMLWH